MSILIDMMEKLGSDASLTPLDAETIQELESEIESTELPEIKCFFVVPAEDDEKGEEPAKENDDKKDAENLLKACSF
ncbi:MAG: hypothetical protein MK214_04355 [Thalassotalea sp.]|nr:hypothetical protein [Thalassotalea sp.]